MYGVINNTVCVIIVPRNGRFVKGVFWGWGQFPGNGGMALRWDETHLRCGRWKNDLLVIFL